MTSAALPALLRRGLTGSAVTGMSIASRVLALLLLVPAARRLSIEEFGTFSVVLGLAVASANLVGSAPSDLIATSVGTTPGRTWSRVTWTVGVLAAVGTALVVVALVAPGPAAVPALGLSVGVTAAAPVVAMSLLRGLDRPVVGAALALLVLPTGRAGAALVADGTLASFLTAVSVVGVGVSGLALLAVVRARPLPVTGTPDRPAGRRRWLAVVAGAGVSATWFALGQSGVLWLSAVAGPEIVAAVVPTMRLCEALTAIAIGYKAAANRMLQTSVDGRFPRGSLVWLGTAFILAAGVMCAVAPALVPVVFGPGLGFAWATALPLIGSSALAVLVAVKVQLLFAAHHHARIAVASAGALVVAVSAGGVGAVLLGAVGVALAMLLTVTCWFLMLTVPRGPAVTPC
ncbi:hypothetical protein DEJ13_02240 [Curtobacterium sp. MCLR17_007]|uniref:hypothetical protein n=1 Tax=Curtobacterium sp. MCLR17_007 TaxID=2175648 RepID=UPI000DB4B96A|nr:hypothetical protein [Curtobacterium sp. MCLR17_007]WIB60669.1 hypothetical protein DEJ13_02240 [Curtobacterium sp. MCLR17_007]